MVLPSFFLYPYIVPQPDFIKTARCEDFCLELSKIKVLKMLDLQTKSAIDLDNLRV